MHDHNPGFLRRTTDIEEKFPDKIINQSSDFTWKELQSLNAGEWFLKVRDDTSKTPSMAYVWLQKITWHRKCCLTFQTDPFCSVSKLSEDERDMARNQTIPSLLELLNLAKEHSISVIFDLYSPDIKSDTEDVVKTILSSGIDPSLVCLIFVPVIKLYCDFSWQGRINKGYMFFFYVGPLASFNKTGICREDRSRLCPGLQWEWNAPWEQGKLLEHEIQRGDWENQVRKSNTILNWHGLASCWHQRTYAVVG